MRSLLSSQDKDPIEIAAGEPLYALVGNPNCGKTTVFNALTGLRQKVGNYPGVTVEKKQGRLRLDNDETVALIDLPGLYSLTPRSPDEAIARDVLLGHQDDVPKPDGVIHVLDASNLERNLYLTSQVLDIGMPAIIVLTMTDVAKRTGQIIDKDALSRELGVPVIPVVVSRNIGLDVLRNEIANLKNIPAPPHRTWSLPNAVEQEITELSEMLQNNTAVSPKQSNLEAIGLLMEERERPEAKNRWPQAIRDHIKQDRSKFEALNIDISTLVIEARYSWVKHVCSSAIEKTVEKQVTLTDKLDRVFTHRIWGYVIFFGVMALVFQTIFTFAAIPMDWIAHGMDALSNYITAHTPAGDLRDLLVNGIIAGVGTIITFLPQIMLLFFFIALLEDTGYMARAAFLMDKIMSKVGLHGKSFIPLLSSFACAIPGIMATRTIDDRKSRLVTILVAPLMSCSARIPVYTLIIAAFIPQKRVLGIFTLPGLTMIAMYFLGMIAAYCMAWLFRKTLLKGASPMFILEMPPYHKPSSRTVLLTMLERATIFLKTAGTVILSMSIVLWFLTTYPKVHTNDPSVALSHSFAGRMGRGLEPMIKPLGFDWRIGVSLVSSFVAREVFVSSMGEIYKVGDSHSDVEAVSHQLKDRLRSDPRYNPLIGICIMVYYVLAMQCLSTIAVVKRETNGWKWPAFMMGYMTALAWTVTFIVYHAGTALGLGLR